MFLKNRLNQINIILTLLFLSILSLLKYEQKLNREEEIFFSDFYVFSNTTSEQRIVRDIDYFQKNKTHPTIQIMSVVLLNNFNKTWQELDKHYKNEIINNEYMFSSDFKFEGLLANTLKMEYYSFDENKFYNLNVSLPYDDILKIAYELSVDDRLETLNLVINILPKGRVVVYFGRRFDQKLVSIATFKAKEILNDWHKLKIYKGNLYGEESEKEDIKNIEKFQDYTDLVTKKYKWSLIIILPKWRKIKEICIKNFNNQNVYIKVSSNSNVFEVMTENRLLPSEIQVDSKTQYSFDGYKILSAFKKLESIKNSTHIELIYNDNNKNFGFCILKRGEMKIPLNDIYK